MHEKFQLIERQEERTVGACEALGDAMNIPSPMRIEAFDNSHMHGADPVSAMVVFIDGKPVKKEYRKYKTRLAAKHDDYGAMQEVIRRRDTRVTMVATEGSHLVTGSRSRKAISVRIGVCNSTP